MIESRTFQDVLVDIVIYLILGLLALVCILPLIHIVAVSFSNRQATTTGIVGLWPIGFNFANYEKAIGAPAFLRSFQVSILRVVLGTILNLLVTVLTAYPLAQRKPFVGQQVFKWILVFAMLFSGGLIPFFLVMKMLSLTDKLGALILPGAVNVFYILVAINFFRSIPVEFSEAAEIDGASHWDILFQIYIPLSGSMIAALALFFAVGHWNAWFDGLVLMRSPVNYPLQTYLQSTIISVMNVAAGMVGDPKMRMLISERAWRAAQIVVASIPILLIYPFLQRYFVTMRMGGIKG